MPILLKVKILDFPLSLIWFDGHMDSAEIPDEFLVDLIEALDGIIKTSWSKFHQHFTNLFSTKFFASKKYIQSYNMQKSWLYN